MACQQTYSTRHTTSTWPAPRLNIRVLFRIFHQAWLVKDRLEQDGCIRGMQAAETSWLKRDRCTNIRWAKTPSTPLGVCLLAIYRILTKSHNEVWRDVGFWDKCNARSPMRGNAIPIQRKGMICCFSPPKATFSMGFSVTMSRETRPSKVARAGSASAAGEEATEPFPSHLR